MSEPVNSSMSYSKPNVICGQTCDCVGVCKMNNPVPNEPVVSQDQEPEAVRFANWISVNNWSSVESGGMWQKIGPGWISERLTTKELYKKFHANP